MDTSEREDRQAARDAGEIDRVFREYRAPLLRYLTFRLRSPQEAEEVLHETFLQYMRVSESTDIHNRYALLVRMASNLAIDRMRQNSSRSSRETEWAGTYYRANSREGVMGAVTASQDRALTARREIEEVIAALKDLSEPVRTAFILHKFEGLSHREVAERMQLAQSTIEKHIMKAMRCVMERFK